MADPLSLVASVIAIAGMAKGTAKAIDKIVSKRHAPILLLRLASQISELHILLDILAEAARNGHASQQAYAALTDVLDGAKGTIEEVHHFIRYDLVQNPQSLEDESEQIQVRWHVWARKEGRLRRMVEKLAAARSSVSSALSALTATSISDLHNVQMDRSDIAQSNENLTNSFKAMELGIMKRLDEIAINGSTPESSVHSEESGTAHHTDAVAPPPPYNATTLARTNSATSTASCTCQCHSPSSGKSPAWLGSSFGTMQLRYNRTTTQSCPSCIRRSCEKAAKNYLNSQYYFPTWLLHRMLAVQYSWDPLAGHRFALRTQRSIPSRSNVFSLAQHGNVEGMKRLFEQRVASPQDVSLEEGRSALHFAMTATQPRMVAFLLSQGADPRLEDRNMLSAYDVCWNYLLQMPGNKDLENLQSSAGLTASDTESLENRKFTPLHRIVLGLSSLGLTSYLETTTADLDAKDSLGKTPLCWAASRPDTSMVETLVHFGASLTIADHRKQSPLHYSAGSGKPRSTELILEAARKQDVHQGQSDSCKCDRDLIDARDSKGRTPLTFAARMNFPEHARLLLSHGADPEAVDTWLDRSVLLSAIYWKSHQVLPVLLAHGSRTDAVDAKRANVLHYAARFGDAATLRVLSKHSLGQFDIDLADETGLSPWQIFESPIERCVHESEEAASDSLRAFQMILNKASGRSSDEGGSVLEELEDDDAEDIFLDAESDMSARATAALTSSEPEPAPKTFSEFSGWTPHEIKSGVG